MVTDEASTVEPTAPADAAEAARPQAVRTKLAQFLWNHMPARLLLRVRPVPPELDPERLTILLRELAKRRDQRGAVVEVGCYRGGTAHEAYRALELWKSERRYVCIDTFQGFVDQQFADDEQLGTPTGLRHVFDVNSARTVRRIFRHFGHEQLEVVKGDIAKLPDQALPAEVAVCLLDVDLAAPTLISLQRIYPRLIPGGIILVDDCEEGMRTGWRARDGYATFCREEGLTEAFDAGFGIVERPA